MSTSMTVRLGVVAWLTVAGSAAARTKDARPDVKAPGGEVWYDEFYSAAGAPAMAVPAPRPRGAAVHRAPGEPPHPRGHAAAALRGRGQAHRVARSR